MPFALTLAVSTIAPLLLPVATDVSRLVTQKVTPGSFACSIQPYDNAWRWKVVYPDGHEKVQGIWSDHVDFVKLDDRDVLRRVQGMTYVTGQSITLISISDPATCAPISIERHNIDGTIIRRVFQDHKVVTDRIPPKGEPSSVTTTLVTETFDFNDGQEALILSSLPLKVGYRATIDTIDESLSSDVPKPIDVRVLRSETLTDPRGKRTSTFVIESEDKATSTSLFWISKSPPYYLRLEVEYPDHRYRLVFDQISLGAMVR